MQGARVWSLVGKLRSHKPHGAAKKKRLKQKVYEIISKSTPSLPIHAVNSFLGETFSKMWGTYKHIYTFKKKHSICSYHIHYSVSFLFLQLIMNLSNLFTCPLTYFSLYNTCVIVHHTDKPQFNLPLLVNIWVISTFSYYNVLYLSLLNFFFLQIFFYWILCLKYSSEACQHDILFQNYQLFLTLKTLCIFPMVLNKILNEILRQLL